MDPRPPDLLHHRATRVTIGFVSAVAFGALPTAASGHPAVTQGRAADLDRPAYEEAVSPLAAAIRNRVEAAASLSGVLSVKDTRARTGPSLSGFYERRGYEPAWVTPLGPTTVAGRLIETLAGAAEDGLRPEDYHLPQLRALIAGLADEGRAPEPERLVDLELLLTDGFLLYGSHLLGGRVDAVDLDPKWRAERREQDMVELLERAVRDGTPRAELHELRPPQAGYGRLMQALATYRAIEAAGGWPVVPDLDEALSPGDEHPAVSALRARLAHGADPDSEGAIVPERYDDTLADAVREFQRRHGLEPDAVVGPATLAALNTPVAERVRQIEVNMERWRWLPEDLGERHVRVNAADFRLEAIDGSEVALAMRAIVGRPYRQTPVFSDRITYIVFRPYWHVPHALAVTDHLPLQKQDSTYFRRLGFRLFSGWGANGVEIDPASIDWSGVTPRSFEYRLRQDPGPQNFLGNAKFMFPNPFNVYLHDTPARELFRKSVRNFSSGCIRVEDSRALALWLLRGNEDWSPRRVDRAMGGTGEETVILARPVPVHLLYWTAFAEDDGAVHFRPDIYDRDPRLAEALAEPPPYAS